MRASSFKLRLCNYHISLVCVAGGMEELHRQGGKGPQKKKKGQWHIHHFLLFLFQGFTFFSEYIKKGVPAAEKNQPPLGFFL